MKKGKLLLGLASLLCLSMLFAACDSANQSNGTESTGTPVEAAPQQVTHEMQDYLVYVDNDAPVWTTVQPLEGEQVDYDADHNLVVMKETDVDVQGNLIEQYKVYDLTNGDVIFEKTNTAPYYSGSIPEDETRVTLTVELQYPVIRALITSERSGDFYGAATTYTASFYEAKKDGELIYETTDNTLQTKINMHGNLYAVTLGDKLFWIDSNMDVLRQVDVIAANGYDTSSFDAEYNGYLYDSTYTSVQIFDRAGLCTFTYTVDDQSSIDCFVLNDGNVLIQQHTEVDIYTEYDYAWLGERIVLTSYMVNAATGEMTEIELDFIVISLESAYTEAARNVDRIFTLAEGRQNKAVIQRLANGLLAKTPAYVVTDNQLAIEYTVKNTAELVDYSIDLSAVDAGLYSTSVAVGGNFVEQVFDLDGNYVCLNEGNAITDLYIVADDIIYDHSMNPIYNARENRFEILGTVGETVFLRQINFVAGATETYVFDATANAPVLLADGMDTLLQQAPRDSYYILYDGNAETYTLYSVNGTTLLTSVSAPTVSVCRDVLLVQTQFNGKPVVRVILP